MSFLKRLFSAFSKSPEPAPPASEPATPASEPASPTAEDGMFKVPDDHRLVNHSPSPEPLVVRTQSGAVIASLGTSSDEFLQDLDQVVDRLKEELAPEGDEAKGFTQQILIAGSAEKISDLFAPAQDLQVSTHAGLVIWTISAESAHLWRPDPARLLQTLSWCGELQVKGEPILQIVLIAPGVLGSANPPPWSGEFVRLLSENGHNTVFVPDDGCFLTEVCRPDATLCAFRFGSTPNFAREASKGDHYLVRAPRLRRLVLDVVRGDGEEALFAELLTRKHSLLLITDREGRSRPQFWGEDLEGFAAYPDLQSLFWAAEDLKIPQQDFGWANFSPRRLLDWAERQSKGVALCSYLDRKDPKYFFIDGETLRRLQEESRDSG